MPTEEREAEPKQSGGHAARVWKEGCWPYQWLGICARCHRGIRCNSRAAADEFFQRAPCPQATVQWEDI